MQITQTQIIDRNGVNFPDDIAEVNENALSVGLFTQMKQMSGRLYAFSEVNIGVANAANVDYRLATPTANRKVILRSLAEPSPRVRARLYENTSFTVLGVQAVFRNISRPITVPSTDPLAAVVAYTTPTVNVLGTLIFDGWIQELREYIWTLLQNNYYLLRLTNLSGAVNDIGIAMQTFI